MENKELTLNEYQKAAMTTCMPSCENFSYMTLNLMGELGEFAHVGMDFTFSFIFLWKGLSNMKKKGR